MHMQRVIQIKLAPPRPRQRTRDRSNRQTTNLVMDARTRANLHGLQEKGKVGEVCELLNSGKEASVYRSGALAVKIFATSAMVFKNRQIYIEGDRRFAQMNTSNSRQLVRLWCEKEFRNLKRVADAGLISVPTPELSSDNILVMELLERAKRLADVGPYLSESRLTKLYYSVIRAMRDLFQKSALVHGDLSEYNIMYDVRAKRAFLIDFGQALDLTNPNAVTLLRVDIRNVNAFFARMGVPVVPNARVLEFVTRPLSVFTSEGPEGENGEGNSKT